MAFLVPQTGAWEYAYRDPQTGLVCYWLDQHGNVGLESVQFADGTTQTTAAFGSSSSTVTTLNVNGGISITGGANVLVKATGGAGGITVTLPTAVGVAGLSATIKKVDNGVGTISIATTGGQTIDGGSGYTLVNQWQFVTVESDGSNWLIVAGN